MAFAVVALGLAGAVEARYPAPTIGAERDRLGSPVTIQQAVFRIRSDQPSPLHSFPISASAHRRDAGPVGSDSLAALIHQEPRLAMLSELISRSGLAWPRPEAHGNTLLAPTDEALRRLRPGVLERLARDPAALDGFLRDHSVDGFLDRASLEARAAVLTRGWKAVDIGGSETVTLNRVSSIQDTLKARDGVIHLVDRPLVYGPGQAPDAR